MPAYFPQFAASGEFRPFFRILNDYERSACASGRQARCGKAAAATQSFAPRVDVTEDDTNYTVLCEVPGIPQENINIEWSEGNTLTITGHVQHRTQSKTPAASEQQESQAEPASPSKENQASVEDDIDAESGDDEAVLITSSKHQEKHEAAEQEAPTTSTPASATQTSKYWVSERRSGSFTRAFTFPNRIDQDGVKASLTNGVLSIAIPKVVHEKKTITIN